MSRQKRSKRLGVSSQTNSVTYLNSYLKAHCFTLSDSRSNKKVNAVLIIKYPRSTKLNADKILRYDRASNSLVASNLRLTVIQIQKLTSSLLCLTQTDDRCFGRIIRGQADTLFLTLLLEAYKESRQKRLHVKHRKCKTCTKGPLTSKPRLTIKLDNLASEQIRTYLLCPTYGRTTCFLRRLCFGSYLSVHSRPPSKIGSLDKLLTAKRLRLTMERLIHGLGTLDKLRQSCFWPSQQRSKRLSISTCRYILLSTLSLEAHKESRQKRLVEHREYNSKTAILQYFIDRAANRLLSCLLYTSPSPRDRQKSRMPSSA